MNIFILLEEVGPLCRWSEVIFTPRWIRITLQTTFSAPSLLEFNKIQSTTEKNHLVPKMNQPSNSQLMIMNAATTTEPSKCGSATTQSNDHVAAVDIVCSPPKKKI